MFGRSPSKTFLLTCLAVLFFALPISVSAVSLTPTQDELQELIGEPQVKIQIPGLDFTPAVVKGEEGNQFLYLPFLGDYIAAVYRYAIVGASVVAIIMIIVAGVVWTTSAGSAGQIDRAKKMLLQAVTGLIVAVGSYTILFAINPELVAFKSLRVKYIETVPLSLENQLTDEFGGDPSDEPDLFSENGVISDGKYRERMMEACQQKNGFSLDSYPKRVERLKSIIETWKKVGVDEGGAIYIRGGSANCSYFNVDSRWLINVMANAYKKDPNLLNLTGACKDSVAQAADLRYKQRGPIGQQFGQQCVKNNGQWYTEYKRLAVDRAKDAGLLCGDCASTVRTLYFQCFNKGNYASMVQSKFNPYRPARKIVPKGSTCKPRGSVDKSLYVFQLTHPSPGDITNNMHKLQFGDIIAWQRGTVGHIMVYTGKEGLDFEMMEMGGGGRGDVSGAGGERAGQLAKIPWNVSGLRVHRSAEKYLQDVAKNKDKCIFAWRPLK